MRLLTVLIAAAVAVGCGAPPKPSPITRGEACWRCRQPIDKLHLAAEFVQDANGLGSKFRTVHCLSTWIAQQRDLPKGRFYVTDHDSRKFIHADRASYVHVVVNRQTMARDFLAFQDAAAAAAAAAEAGARVVGWDEVLAAGRERPIGGD
jgi:copper chaperone NosL